MKTKEEIVKNWLPRYTGEKLDNFGQYILVTNFSNYITLFAEWNGVPVKGINKPMQCATAEGMSIINFGMGSPTAATVMDLLVAIEPKAVLFLLGTEMDYKIDKLSAQFVFNNPNQTGSCGCGESVAISPAAADMLEASA